MLSFPTLIFLVAKYNNNNKNPYYCSSRNDNTPLHTSPQCNYYSTFTFLACWIMSALDQAGPCLQVILLMNVMNIINEPCNCFQFFNLPRAWLTFFRKKKKKIPEDLGPIKLQNPCNNSKRQSKGKSMIFQMK